MQLYQSYLSSTLTSRPSAAHPCYCGSPTAICFFGRFLVLTSTIPRRDRIGERSRAAPPLLGLGTDAVTPTLVRSLAVSGVFFCELVMSRTLACDPPKNAVRRHYSGQH